MWLALDLGGIDFRFRVRDYKKSSNENWFFEWCQVDLTLQSGNWLHYCISTENLVCAEVEKIRDTLLDFLQNKRNEPETITFIEPDLSFHVVPSERTRSAGMDLRIHLWHAGLTNNSISLFFDRDDLEKFCSYLQLITGAITRKHETVQRLLEEKALQEDQ